MLQFIKKYPQLLLFGILTAMFSGPGQTFLVSLFIPSMREAFGITQTQIAGFYSLATLVSAFTLPFIGKLLDRSHLTVFTLIAGVLLAVGCLVLSQSTQIWMVIAGFVLIRNFGQGAMGMISSTTMARTFGPARGKALGVSNLGYPLGEAVFPLMMTAWIAAYGWRSGWVFLAALTLFFFSPVIILLMRRNPQESALEDFSVTEKTENIVRHEGKDWEVAEVLRDRRFYLLIIPILIPPAFLTALFFHQAWLMEWKGWDLTTIAAGFVGYAACRGAVSFFVGPVIDRLTAKKIFPCVLIPLGIGISFMALGRTIPWSFAYLAFAGLSMGLSMTVGNALYAELYGIKALGSIRGVTSSMIVFSTAAAPIGLGWILDHGFNPNVTLWSMVGTIILGVFLSRKACRTKIKNSKS